MRIGMQLPYAGNLATAMDQAVALDRAGLDVLWTSEAYGFDAVSLMGYLAARTERVQIGSAILPIYSRTPALLAQTAAGVDYVSGGRAILGLGASGPQVIEGWHGVPYDRPLQRTREVIDICRAAWRRDRLTHDGLYTVPLPAGQGTGLGRPLKMVQTPVRDRIPIYVAALGPRNVEMTAEVADGWLPLFYLPEKAPEAFGEALARGAARRSADLGPLEVAAGGAVAIGDDVEGLRDTMRPSAALYIGGMGARGRNFYNDLARRYGFESEAAEVQDLYLAGNREEAARAVPAEFVERTNLIGSAGYVRDRVQAFRDAGVTILNIQPIAGDPVRTLEQVREWAA